ncbi:MAG TPA: hypothetical protein VGZ69_04425 [Candidatus Rhabdochlamydia sp.]|jgi:hypothetical protein|nr:hypothetical protein [Candidatus Rhabdochlamydia sp.]
MRLFLTDDQKEFFQKHRFIEIEGLFSLEKIAQIEKLSDLTLTKRLHAKNSPLLQGYDLWRDNKELKEILHNRSLIKIIAELFNAFPLRIAFDQYIKATSPSPIQATWALEELSCIKPLAGSMLIPLSFSKTLKSHFPFPQKGNVLFLAPDYPIPWPLLFALEDLKLLIVSFAPEKAIYQQETRDPHQHVLKKWGYVFGDSLNNQYHPLLIVNRDNY